MSSIRQLSDRLAWTTEQRSFELLDWETRPEDFDLLCNHITELLVTRIGITRQQIFSTLPEPQFRHEVRAAAQMFQERYLSLPTFIFMRLKYVVFPKIMGKTKE